MLPFFSFYNQMKDESTKQKILDALEDDGEERKLRCPFCDNDTFFRSAIERDCKVYIYNDGEGIRDEDIGMAITEYTYKCFKCDKDVTEEELK